MKSLTGKKTKITAMALVLVLLLALGGTAAFLTAKSDIVTNEFKGAVAISVEETTGDTYNILPGTIEAKDPTVTLKNKEGNIVTDTDVYAYVIIHEENNEYGEDDTEKKKIVNYEIADGWEALEGYPADEDFLLDPEGLKVTVNAGDKVYWRSVAAKDVENEYPVLKDNQVSYDAKVEYKDIGTDDKATKLAFQAYAIQKVPFNNPLKAWNQEKPKELPKKGDIITIDGDKFRVLSLKGSDAFVMSMYDVSNGGSNYHDWVFSEPGVSAYAGSKIDNYLNMSWLGTRSSDFRDAIKPTAISQYEYTYSTDKPESGSYYEAYLGFNDPMQYYIEEIQKLSDVGERYVYLPDIKDVVNYLGKGNITPENVNEMFFGVREKERNGCWLRSSKGYGWRDGWCIDGNHGSIGFDSDQMSYEIRAAFTIDLTMVDFEVYPQAPPKPIANMPAKGDIITIDGIGEYRVLDASKTRAFVMSMNDVSEPEAGTIYGDDGGEAVVGEGVHVRQYAGSNIDDYLENVWYAGLDSDIKSKIIGTPIQQNVFEHSWNDDLYRFHYNGKLGFGESQLEFCLRKFAAADVGKRHVYLLDIKDVVDYLGQDNIKPENVNKMFFNTEESVDKLCWLRSAYYTGHGDSYNDLYCINGKHGSMCGWDKYTQAHEARAAFTIILDGVNFEIKK